MQLQGVAPLPGGAAGASDGQVELVALAQAAALLSCRGQAAHLPVLVHRLCDPLGVGVASDGLVEGVDQDHLEELVGGVLAHPVGVEHSEASAVTASTLLQTQGARDRLESQRVYHQTGLNQVVSWLTAVLIEAPNCKLRFHKSVKPECCWNLCPT